MKGFLNNLPEVKGPEQTKLSFNTKLKWTLTILIIFYVLGVIPLYGLGANSLEQFEFLSVILGASFGSVISLGIGPLVTASIVLQLLNGSGLVNFDLTTDDGKRTFQGVQKLLSIFFVIFESIIYVFMGGLSPDVGQSAWFLVFQLIIGGTLIMFMDEVISKWGFGSGISLFIVAGVSNGLVTRLISWLPSPTNPGVPSGAIPALIQSISGGDPTTALLMIVGIISTAIVFVVAVFAQAMKVEIPLSFGRVRGHGIRWPLSFMYTSNIPVILIAALLANVQLWAGLMQNRVADSGIMHWMSVYLFGQVGTAESGFGLVYYINPVNIVGEIVKQGTLFIGADLYVRTLVFILIMAIGSMVFSIFWIQTSGQDAKSVAKQMVSSGLQLPGFRRDERVLERVLNRYIWPLTVMGGLSIGLLAALADVSGALASGTGLLLVVMIVYKLYEEIAKQHMMDMNPMMRKFME